jgi:ABC transporter substrate binding protein
LEFLGSQQSERASASSMIRAAAALLGATLLALGLGGHQTGAQPRVARIALVQVAMPVAEMTETGSVGHRAFFAELRRLGWIEDQNLTIERRSGEGWTARYPELAREGVGLRPEVIVAGSSRLVRALKAATTTFPVVAIMFTPVEAGLVASLARPGGNVTGVSVDAGLEIIGKRLEPSSQRRLTSW